MTTLPTKNGIHLLLAEDVRLEAAQKLSILGAFIGNSIRVREIGATKVISLAAIIYLTEGEGKFSAKIELRQPSGKVLISDTQTIDKDRGRPTTHIMKFMTFPLPEEGEWKFSVSLDGTAPFELPFTITHDPTVSF